MNMDRWSGKIAVVTGASSGIGASVAKQLVISGMTVIGLARRVDRLEELKQSLKNTGGEFHCYECDVSKLESIKDVFSEIKKTYGRVHVLINNAGMAKHTTILNEGNEDELKSVMDTNFFGTVYCTKETYNIMKDIPEECTIINIGSILGYSTPLSMLSASYNVYPASKFAIRAASEVIRQELISNNNFRITTLSPGLVRTEIAQASGHPQADHLMNYPCILEPEDIAETIAFILSAPKHVQITELIIKPVGEKF